MGIIIALLTIACLGYIFWFGVYVGRRFGTIKKYIEFIVKGE